MLTIITILLGVFCSAMEALVTSTIMPTIISDLGGFNLYPWVSNSFMLASVVTAPFAGALADAFGYKKSYIGSVILFLLGSFLCGFASSMPELIVFRVFQGFGSSALLTLSLVLFGALFPIEKRARMQALIGAMWALASILGPALGAFLTSKLSWQWAFWINIPFGLLILISFIFRTNIPEPERKPFKMDFAGGALFSLGTLGLVYGLLKVGKLQMEALDWALLVLGLSFLVYFFITRKKMEHPFIPLYLFENKAITLPVIMAFFAGLFLFCVASFTPLFVQGVLGQAASTAGKVVTSVAVGSFMGSLVSGALLNRIGFRIMSTFGVVVAGLGFFFLLNQDSQTTLSMLMLGNFMVGCGVSAIANANMVAVQAVSPVETLGSATSMVSFARTFGGMIGIAAMGGLQLGLFQSGMMEISGLASHDIGIVTQKLFDPMQRHTMNQYQLHSIVDVFTHSLQGVFMGCGLLAFITLIFSLQMPNLSPKQVKEVSASDV